MTTFLIINILLVLFVLIYGMTLGISNFWMRIKLIFSRAKIATQSNFGRAMDITWALSIAYFATIGKPALIKIIELSQNLAQFI